MNKKRVVYLISATVILILASCVAYLGLFKKNAEIIPNSNAKSGNNQKNQTSSNKKPEENQQSNPIGTISGFAAPGFELNDLSGKNIKLSEFKGKPVLVTFWRVGSSESEDQLAKLNELDKAQERPSDLVILSVNYMDSKSIIEKAILEKQYKFNILLDLDSKVTESYKIATMPTTFLISPEGTIYELWTSEVDSEQLLDKISQMKAAY
jgi:peroxiredoxin